MAHADDERTSRLERSREILREAGLTESAAAADALRFYRFDESAESISAEQVGTMAADGSDTQFHTAIETIVDDAKAGGHDIDAMLILSDETERSCFF